MRDPGTVRGDIGRCAACGARYGLTAAGNLHPHLRTTAGVLRARRVVCEGTGTRPLDWPGQTISSGSGSSPAASS